MRIELSLQSLDDVQGLGHVRIFVGEKMKTEIRKLQLTCCDTAGIEDPAAAQLHFDFISGAAPMGSYGPRKR